MAMAVVATAAAARKAPVIFMQCRPGPGARTMTRISAPLRRSFLA